MSDDDLFDNGIDGEPYFENSSQADADRFAMDKEEHAQTREDFDVHSSIGLEISGWPTYGNYTIITNTFHMYYWPGNDTIEVFDKRIPHSEFPSIHKHVFTIKNKDLRFFGEWIGPDKWDVDFYSAEEIDKKVQRYLNLKAFL